MRRAMSTPSRCSVGAWSVAGLVLLVSACTTYRPVAEAGDELRGRILDGELLAAGDRVRLTTADRRVHKVRIDSLDLDAGTISADRAGSGSVRVADVVALERRVRAPAKTWALVGALALLVFGSDCEDDPSCDLGYGGLCC